MHANCNLAGTLRQTILHKLFILPRILYEGISVTSYMLLCVTGLGNTPVRVLYIYHTLHMHIHIFQCSLVLIINIRLCKDYTKVTRGGALSTPYISIHSISNTLYNHSVFIAWG